MKNIKRFQIKGLGPAPWVHLGGGSKNQHSNFSEHGHVAYQIKWNHKCNNMVLNTLPTYTPPHTGGGVKRSKLKFFQNMVLLLIKKGIMNAATWKKIFLQSDRLPPDLWVLSKVKIQIFQNTDAYKIKKNHQCSNMVANIFPQTPPPPPPPPDPWGQKVKNNLFHNMVMLDIKLK